MSGGGPRVLIVEDDFIVGEDLRRMVLRLGLEAVGPISGTAPALAVVRDVRLDAALLDVQIDDGLSFRVAEALETARVPYAVVTGLQTVVRGEPRFASRRVVVKPVRLEAVAAVLREWGLPV